MYTFSSTMNMKNKLRGGTHMKMKKIISIIIISTVFGSILAGCSKKEEVKPQTQQATKIKFMTWESNQKNFSEAINAFNKDNKDIQVEVIATSDNEYPDKLTVSLSAGTDIDVFATKTIPDYSDLVVKNQCLDLGTLIDKNKFDLKNYGTLANNLKLNDKLYGLPYYSTTWGLYYNKDIFDKAGIAYPKADMTWNEFRELAKNLTKGQGNDKVWGTFIQTWDTLTEMSALQKGKTILSEDLTSQKESIQFLADLYKDGSASDWGTNKSTSAHYRAAFEKGNVAMVPMGDFCASALIQDKKDGKHNVNWDITALPHPDGVAANTTFGTVTPISINAKSSKVDAAWKFISYIAGEPGASYASKAGVTPGYKDDAIKKTISSVDGMPKGFATLLDAKVLPEQPTGKNVKSSLNVFLEQAELYYIGKYDLDTTMKNIEAKRKVELSK